MTFLHLHDRPGIPDRPDSPDFFGTRLLPATSYRQSLLAPPSTPPLPVNHPLQLRYALLASLLLTGVSGIARAQDVSDPDAITPFTLDGSINLSAGTYAVSGIEARQSPFTWTIAGSLTPTVYSVALPFSFVVSEQERDFRQPFNEFGISPRYKWITAHLGFRSMTMGRYTLAGEQFLGAGIELSPGPFRASFAYGRFQRAVEEDTAVPGNIPAYERKGWGARIGGEFESGAVGISVFHALDDSLSLKRRPVETQISPAENTVIGADLRTELLTDLVLDADIGASLYTRDVTSPTIDLDSAGLPKVLGDVQDVRLSTTLTTALRAGLSYRLDNIGIRLGYERIEPDFVSLGSAFFPTDIQSITVAPSLTLLEGNLRMSGSVGFQQDNLLGTKLAKTNRVIGSANIGWQASQEFGIDGQFTNYSTDQSSGRVVLNDTVRIRNVTRSLMLSPRLILNGEGSSQSFLASLAYQDFRDQNPATRTFGGDNSVVTGTLFYSLADLTSPRSIGGTLTVSQTLLDAGNSTTISLGVNGSMSLLAEDALALSSSLTASTISTGGTTPSSSIVFNESLGASYRISPDDAVSLSAYSTQSRPREGVTSSFTEVGVQLGYNRNFAIVKGE